MVGGGGVGEGRKLGGHRKVVANTERAFSFNYYNETARQPRIHHSITRHSILTQNKKNDCDDGDGIRN